MRLQPTPSWALWYMVHFGWTLQTLNSFHLTIFVYSDCASVNKIVKVFAFSLHVAPPMVVMFFIVCCARCNNHRRLMITNDNVAFIFGSVAPYTVPFKCMFLFCTSWFQSYSSQFTISSDWFDHSGAIDSRQFNAILVCLFCLLIVKKNSSLKLVCFGQPSLKKQQKSEDFI
jgi:hypothetical protein